MWDVVSDTKIKTLVVVSMKITVFWDVLLCSLVDMCTNSSEEPTDLEDGKWE
jgi:hypothetical protein